METCLARVHSQQFNICEKNKPLIKLDVKTSSKRLNNRTIPICHQPMTTSKNTLLQIENEKKGWSDLTYQNTNLIQGIALT